MKLDRGLFLEWCRTASTINQQAQSRLTTAFSRRQRAWATRAEGSRTRPRWDYRWKGQEWFIWVTSSCP